jgi:nucleoid-associated protein YgaU
MEKERIAKWEFTQATGTLALINSKTKEVVGVVELTDVPGFKDLPEYAQFYLQYGIKQKVADPNAGEKGLNKLEGMVLNLEAWKEITFARAKAEKGESISIVKMVEFAKTKADLAYVKATAEGMGKTLPLSYFEKEASFKK